MKNFALLLVTLILCAFVMSGCAQKGITAEKFDKDPQKVLEASIDYEQLWGIDNDMVKAMNAGKIQSPESARLTFSIDLASITADDTMPALEVTLAGTQDKTDIDLEFAMGEFLADARLYIDGDMLVLESESALGGAYSVKFEDLSTFVEKFDNSELAKALNLPEGTAAAFCEQYGINDEYIAGVKAAWDDMVNADGFNSLVERMTQAVQPEFTPAVEETVEINGTQTEVVTATTVINEEMYANIMGEYFAFVEEIIVSLKDLTSAAVPEVIKQQTGLDINSEFDNAVDNYNATIQDMMGNMVMEGSVKYYLEKATGKLLKMDYDYDYQMAGMPIKYLLTADLTDGFKINGTMTADSQTVEMDMDIVHTEQDNSESWTMNITQFLPDEEPVATQMALTLNKNDGTYRLTVTADGEETSVNGTYKAEKDLFELTVDTMETMGESVQLGITVGYAENIEIAAPEHKELLTLTEDELYALVGRISTFAMTFPAPQPDYGYDDEYYDYYTDDEYYDYYGDDEYYDYYAEDDYYDYYGDDGLYIE